MTKDKTTETHESYGVIQISNAHGDFSNLFGSNIKTQHAIHLSIRKAERDHALGGDYIHGRQELISLYMSPLQFAEFLTSMGKGEGTPCTLSSVAGNSMEQPPATEATARKVVKEFVRDTREVATFARKAGTLVDDILSKGQKMKKGDREELQSIFSKMSKLVTDSAPFMIERAEEHINTMVSEARATITQHSNTLGVEAGAVDLAQGMLSSGVSRKDKTEAPEIPSLPEREIDSLVPAVMSSKQVAEKIHRHLRLLRNHAQNPLNLHEANAWEARGQICISYVSYQGSFKITLKEAQRYLAALDEGFTERHTKMLP